MQELEHYYGERTFLIKAYLFFNGLLIDDSAHKVFVNDLEIDLTPKEYELLCFLAENAGIALSRETILIKVWGYDYFGDLRTVDTHVKRLRVKLDNQSDFIQTVRGVGYRFEVQK